MIAEHADIHRLIIPTALPVGAVNLYVLSGEPLTLVDTGPDSASGLAELERGLTELGYRIEHIELVVLTHEHPDHAGLGGVVAARTGAVVAGHRAMLDAMADYAATCRAQEAYARDLLRRHGVDRVRTEAACAYMRALDLWGASVEVTHPLDDGDVLTAGGRTWQVHHRPGHSASDILLYDRASGLVLAGDHLLDGISSIAAMTRPRDSRAGDRCRALTALRASLQRSRDMDMSIVLPGHGSEIGDAAGLINKRLNQQAHRAERLLDLLGGEPRTAFELTGRLFGPVPIEQAYLVVTEVLGHLDLLLDAGLIAEDHGENAAHFRRA